MPTYTINLDGKTIKLKGDREPTEAETREAVNNYFKSPEVEDYFNVPEEEKVSKSLTDKDVKQKESSGNPLAKNLNTSADGLYQITDAAKTDVIKFKPELKDKDYSLPEIQEEYRTVYKKVLSNQLKSKGVEVNIDNINRAWVIGAGGMKMLQDANPDSLLKDVLPKSYFKLDKNNNSINPNLENKTVKEFMNDPNPYSRK